VPQRLPLCVTIACGCGIIICIGIAMAATGGGCARVKGVVWHPPARFRGYGVRIRGVQRGAACVHSASMHVRQLRRR
jgi:hypothetical protein